MSTNLMLCRHYKTTMKKVAWATKSKGRHSQGFIWTECCSHCGCIIKQKDKKC